MRQIRRCRLKQGNPDDVKPTFIATDLLAAEAISCGARHDVAPAEPFGCVRDLTYVANYQPVVFFLPEPVAFAGGDTT